MYQPNFCAECGERVPRGPRRLLASRRFCTRCARRFRRGRVLRPLVVAVALVACGFLFGRAGRPAAPSAVGSVLSLAPLPAGGATKRQEPAHGGQGTQAAQGYGPDGSANERPTEPDEVISVCGARTKKGAPCSRRVRGTGRCWQHRGKPAALPPSKLIVPN